MNGISAQVSLYPLRQVDLEAAVDEVIGVLSRSGLEVRPGAMSTVVIGESRAVFAALNDAFDHADRRGEVVMTVTLSNACPVCAAPAVQAPRPLGAVPAVPRILRYAGAGMRAPTKKPALRAGQTEARTSGAPTER